MLKGHFIDLNIENKEFGIHDTKKRALYTFCQKPLKEKKSRDSEILKSTIFNARSIDLYDGMVLSIYIFENNIF